MIGWVIQQGKAVTTSWQIISGGIEREPQGSVSRKTLTKHAFLSEEGWSSDCH